MMKIYPKFFFFGRKRRLIKSTPGGPVAAAVAAVDGHEEDVAEAAGSDLTDHFEVGHMV
jgi:hypothetical protein